MKQDMGGGAGSRGRDTQWGGGLSNAALWCNTTAFVAFTKKKKYIFD